MKPLRLFGVLALSIATAGLATARPPQSGPQPLAPTGTVARLPVSAAAPNPDSVYAFTDVRPRFVGGEAALAAYIRRALRYPPQALQRKLSGKVFVTFVLGTTGKVQDVHVSRGLGYGLDDEALRVVWLMPAWAGAAPGPASAGDVYAAHQFHR